MKPLDEKTHKGKLRRNVGFVNGMPIVYYGDNIVRPNQRVGSGLATRSIPAGINWRGHNAGTSQMLKPKGKKSGTMSTHKGIKNEETEMTDIEAILNIKQMFDECETDDDMTRLYYKFLKEGVSPDDLSAILELTEDDIEALKNTEDEKSEVIQLYEAAPSRAHFQHAVNAVMAHPPAERGEIAAAHAAIFSKMHSGFKATNFLNAVNGEKTYRDTGKLPTLQRRHFEVAAEHIRNMPNKKAAAAVRAHWIAMGHKSNPLFNQNTFNDKSGLYEDTNEEAVEMEPTLAQQIMMAVINNEPATVQDIVSKAMKSGLNHEVDVMKDDLFGTDQSDDFSDDEPPLVDNETETQED